MLNILFVLIVSLNQSSWDDVDSLHMRIKNEDVVFVGRLVKFDDYYKTQWLDPEGNGDFGEVYILRFRFSPILTIKGNVGSEITVLCTSTFKPMYFHDEHGWSGSSFSNGRIGDVYFIFAKKPNEKNIIRTGIETYNIKAENSSQVLYFYPYQSMILPELNYLLEGNTPVERAISVFSQAYLADPKGDLNKQQGPYFLYKILHLIPRWKLENGKPVLYATNWDGPQIYEFFREKIQPRLFKVEGDDPILKARALFMSICTGDLSKLEEYKQLVDEIDKTHPKTDDEHVLMGLFGDKQYALKMMNARLDSIRSMAFSTIDETEMPKAFRYGIQPNSVISLIHPHVELAVNALQNDPSWQVQVAAASWLNAFRYKHIEAYRDAPVAKIIEKEVTNKQAVIDYWLGK